MSQNTVRARLFAGAVCSLCSLFLVAPSPPVRAQEAPAPAAVKEAKPVTLALVPRVGDSARYKFNIAVALGGGMTITFDQTRTETISQVADRDLVVTIESDAAKITVDGNTQEQPDGGAPVALILTRGNKILQFTPQQNDSGYLSPAALHLMALIDRIVLPETPVKPGDTWTTEVDNPAVKSKKVTIKTTYVGEEKPEGGTASTAGRRFHQTIEADTEDVNNKLKADVTALLDAGTSQLIESQQTVSGLPSNSGPVGWKGTLKRIKDAAGAADAGKKPAAPAP